MDFTLTAQQWLNVMQDWTPEQIIYHIAFNLEGKVRQGLINHVKDLPKSQTAYGDPEPE